MKSETDAAPAQAGLDRRSFLAATGAASLAAMLGARRAAAAPPGASAEARGFPGLIVREQEPENLEFPFPTLDGFITPTERFYVRNHFGIPEVDAASWKLKVEGAVERPLEIGLAELTAMPAKTTTALLECAGNGRAFLVPKSTGVGWELGAVGNAEWTGVPLSAVLERAGVKASAVEVVLEGADSGEVKGPPASPGKIKFARGLPLDKARRPEVLLAWKMNGAGLTAAHGRPVRAVVPGWYGAASVKWLSRIVVVERPFQGFFQTMDYSYFERRDGLPAIVPLADLQIKSEIARPARSEKVPADADYRVYGAAWSGESAPAKVEFSADGGKTWAEGKLLGEPVPFSWRLWEYKWRTPAKPGRYVLMSRATDAKGRAQPEKHDPDRRNYMINFTLPVAVEVH